MALEDDLKQSKKMSPRQHAVLGVLHTASVVETYINSFLVAFDLTHQQYNILRILNGNAAESMSVLDIQSRMIDRNSNVSRLVEKLRKRGLVIRKENPEDRRRVDVSITQDGIILTKKVEEERKNKGTKEQHFSEEDAQKLSELLDKFRTHFKQ